MSKAHRPTRADHSEVGVTTQAVKRFGYEGGTFPASELYDARRSNSPLTMDCALPGPCLNNCAYCGFIDVNTRGKLRPKEIRRVFAEFAALGGKSIKILGEGEPLLRKDMLSLVEYVRELGMIPVLFTCGDVLGNEELAQEYHSRSCRQIVQDLYGLGVTVMLKYEKMDQDAIVRRPGISRMRDRALELLFDAGFARHFPSRLGFAIVLMKSNFAEISVIYDFAFSHNIYPLVCPLMPIGRTKDPQVLQRLSPKPDEIRSLTSQLLEVQRSHGISLNIESDFPGGLPCDISRAGMYMDDIGLIRVCEADDAVGSVREHDVSALWKRCSQIKDEKYGTHRWLGLCFPKRCAGICPTGETSAPSLCSRSFDQSDLMEVPLCEVLCSRG